MLMFGIYDKCLLLVFTCLAIMLMSSIFTDVFRGFILMAYLHLCKYLREHEMFNILTKCVGVE